MRDGGYFQADSGISYRWQFGHEGGEAKQRKPAQVSQSVEMTAHIVTPSGGRNLYVLSLSKESW